MNLFPFPFLLFPYLLCNFPFYLFPFTFHLLSLNILIKQHLFVLSWPDRYILYKVPSFLHQQ